MSDGSFLTPQRALAGNGSGRRLSSSLCSELAGPAQSGLEVRQPPLRLGNLAIDLCEFDQQFLTPGFQVGLHG
jgi:hypothetical protein